MTLVVTSISLDVRGGRENGIPETRTQEQVVLAPIMSIELPVRFLTLNVIMAVCPGKKCLFVGFGYLNFASSNCGPGEIGTCRGEEHK